MMTKYVLPELPYDAAALEPHISGKIMSVHHDKHHKAYVTGANETVEKVLEARHKGDFSAIAALQQKLAFNVSGHLLHCLFWQNLAPTGGGKPVGELAAAIDRDFHSFDAFKRQMNAVAGATMGSGWAALVWDPLSRRLGTTLIHDHQNEVTQAAIPLLVMDAWEHAYYLQYNADKAKFFDALWNLWNWEDVAQRFGQAQRLDLGLNNAVEAPAADGRPSPQPAPPSPS